MRTLIGVLFMSAVAAAQEPPDRASFFRKAVDFFDAKPKTKPLAPVWDGDKPPAGPTLDLLQHPSPETARRYLEWQRSRLEQLQKALEALEAARRAEATPEILYFTRADCPFCREQEKLLGDLPVRRVMAGESPELWARYGIRATPSFVVGTKTFTGITGREILENALKETKP